MIKFRTTIYVDAISMFRDGFSDKDVRDELACRFRETDIALSDVRDALEKKVDDGEIPESALDYFDDIAGEPLADMVGFDRADSEIDLSEVDDLMGTNLVPVSLGCELDEKKLVKGSKVA